MNVRSGSRELPSGDLDKRSGGMPYTRSAHAHAAINARDVKGNAMDYKLTPEEREWLRQLDIDNPIKPELPSSIGDRFVELGLAIRLVEGGLQLTALGRERLSEAGNRSV
jgi:hypothetical protein